jgi:hypothetical protein
MLKLQHAENGKNDLFESFIDTAPNGAGKFYAYHIWHTND